MEENILYTEQLNFMISKEIKHKLEDYAKQEGVKFAVIIRKALVKYLKEKQVLDQDKNYL